MYHPYRFDGRVETASNGGFCLYEGSLLITNLHIDGFNLYYRWAKQGTDSRQNRLCLGNL